MTMSGQRVIRLTVVFVWLMATVLFAIPLRHASAAQITSRKLVLQARSGVGGSTPNVAVNHQFEYTLPGNNTVGEVKFEYCTTASGTCTPPPGLDTSSASLGTMNNLTFSGVTSDSANVIRATRVAASIGTNVAVTTQLLNVHNPTAANTSFYVRITSDSSTTTTLNNDGDTGVVAGSTATPIQLSGYMPESLIFCTGGTINTTGGVPDCSTATTGSLTFPDFSPSATSFITSQMSASTNADFGYSITYSGATMTSGSNTVTPMDDGSGGPTTSVIGTSQFGLNLVDNATPNVGSALNPASSNGTTHQGNVATNYATADSYLFKTAGDTVANSDFDNPGTSKPSDSQIYTVSYIVNANGAQPVGTYQTTITYVCTPTF